MQAASDPRSRSRLQPRLQPMHSGRPLLRPCTVPAKTSFPPTHPTEKFPLTIESFNDVTVHFRGSDALGSLTIYGTIDRVTGDVEATSVTKTMATLVRRYALKCRPAQRLF